MQTLLDVSLIQSAGVLRNVVVTLSVDTASVVLRRQLGHVPRSDVVLRPDLTVEMLSLSDRMDLDVNPCAESAEILHHHHNLHQAE